MLTCSCAVPSMMHYGDDEDRAATRCNRGMKSSERQTDSGEKKYDNKFLQTRTSSHVGLKAEAEEAALDGGNRRGGGFFHRQHRPQNWRVFFQTRYGYAAAQVALRRRERYGSVSCSVMRASETLGAAAAHIKRYSQCEETVPVARSENLL